jgi:alpha-ketoglutarate-dependent taurine dioxygenase
MMVFEAQPHTWTDWLAASAISIWSRVLADGAVLLRGLPLTGPAEVTQARAALGLRPFRSKERFAHRQEEKGALSPICWPDERELCPYQEEAFSTSIPGVILTGCVQAPDSGGAARLSDARRLAAYLPPALSTRIRTHGWYMTRVFHPNFGLSWQEAFACRDQATLSSLCAREKITCEWLNDGSLRTSRWRPAFRIHPVTGEECWFNQLAFLNQGSLEARDRELLSLAFGEHLPVDTLLGDGQALSASDLLAIHDAYDATTTRLSWRAGDLLIVDNILTAQGRDPLTGSAEYWIAFGKSLPGSSPCESE